MLDGVREGTIRLCRLSPTPSWPRQRSVTRIADGSTDILLVDRSHRYENAPENFGTDRPKLSKRAVVLFHGNMEIEQDFGVWQLWADREGQHPDSSLQFHYGQSPGVLGVGSDIPAEIMDFFFGSCYQPRSGSRG